MHADPLLAASAQEYADEAAVVQGFGLAWETDNSTALAAALQRRLRKHGVRHVEAATVLAAGFADAGSVLAAWLKDDRTAQIISNAKYTHAGVGHVQAGSDAGFWVVDLIRHEDGNLTPAESCPAAAAAASPRAAPERPAGRTGGSGARVTAFAVFAPPATDPAEMAAWRSAARMVCLVNRERQRHRRLPVMVDRDVMRSAVSHARKQALHSKMQHEGFADGGGGAGKPSKAWDRLRAQSREFWAAGETAARGFETEEDVVNAWMASADHRRVILNVRFNRFGSGKALSPDGTVYWTQTFAQGRHWGGHQFAVCPPGSEPPPWTKRVRTRISKAQNAGGS